MNTPGPEPVLEWTELDGYHHAVVEAPCCEVRLCLYRPRGEKWCTFSSIDGCAGRFDVERNTALLKALGGTGSAP